MASTNQEVEQVGAPTASSSRGIFSYLGNLEKTGQISNLCEIQDAYESNLVQGYQRFSYPPGNDHIFDLKRKIIIFKSDLGGGYVSSREGISIPHAGRGICLVFFLFLGRRHTCLHFYTFTYTYWYRYCWYCTHRYRCCYRCRFKYRHTNGYTYHVSFITCHISYI